MTPNEQLQRFRLVHALSAGHAGSPGSGGASPSAPGHPENSETKDDDEDDYDWGSARLPHLAQDRHECLRCARLNQWHLEKLINSELRSHRNRRDVDDHRRMIPDRQATQ
jgi:hypothetical protein